MTDQRRCYQFKDHNRLTCEIYEASNYHPTLALGSSYPQMMYLTQEQLKTLIPLLQHFVDTGRLPETWEVEI